MATIPDFDYQLAELTDLASRVGSLTTVPHMAKAAGISISPEDYDLLRWAVAELTILKKTLKANEEKGVAAYRAMLGGRTVLADGTVVYDDPDTVP